MLSASIFVRNFNGKIIAVFPSYLEHCTIRIQFYYNFSHPSSRSRNSSGNDFLHVQASNSQQRSSCPVEVPSSSRGRQSDIEESPTCGRYAEVVKVYHITYNQFIKVNKMERSKIIRQTAPNMYKGCSKNRYLNKVFS